MCGERDTLLHEPRYTPFHVYEAIKYLNLKSFCSPLDCFTRLLARHLAGVSCFIRKISEAIRDVEQTTAPSAKLNVLNQLSTTQDRAQDAQKTPMFN